jgi:2-oxo-4-hydroxy-4-carboxy--5-ureidoimidazoline (OHCU) decarboxylase
MIKKIRAVFLTKKNEAEFVKNIHKSTTPNDWILRRTKKESTFSKIAKMVSMYSNYFEKNAKKHNFKVLNTDYNFDETIDEAISYLVMK